MNQRRSGALLSYVSIFVYIIIGFIYVPFLLKYLGRNEYGLYQLMGSIVFYFSLFDFGLSATVVRYYSHYLALSQNKKAVNSLGISRIIYYFLTVVSLSLGVILYFFIDDVFSNSLSEFEIYEAKIIYLLLLVNISIKLLSNIYNSIITAHENFVFLKVLTIVQQVLQPLVIIFLISLHPYALTIVFIQTLVNLLVSIIKYVYSQYKLKVRIHLYHFDKELVTKMLKFSASIFIVSVVDQVFWRSNQLLLGVISGTSVVALYSIAVTIYMNYLPLSGVIQSVFLPKITQMVSKKVANDELSAYFMRIGRIQFIILSCVLSGFVVFGKIFISLWVGKEYMPAFWIALIVLVPFTIDLIQNLGLTILQAKNKYAFKAKVYSLMALLNIILAVIMIKFWGPIGAAIATGLSMFIGNGLIMNWYYYKKVHLNIPLFWKQIVLFFPVILIPMMSGILLKLLFPITSLVELMASVVLYAVIFFISMWSLGMNQYEKELVKSIVHLGKSNTSP